jgi:hypothetical protein
VGAASCNALPIARDDSEALEIPGDSRLSSNPARRA